MLISNGGHRVIRYARTIKCLNVREWVEVVKRNKNAPLPNPTVLWIVSVRERKKKQTKKHLCLHFKFLPFHETQVKMASFTISTFSSRPSHFKAPKSTGIHQLWSNFIHVHANPYRIKVCCIDLSGDVKQLHAFFTSNAFFQLSFSVA